LSPFKIPENFDQLTKAISEQSVSLFHSSCEDFRPFFKLKELFPTRKGCEETRERGSNYENVRLTDNENWFFDSEKFHSDSNVFAVEIPFNITLSNKDLYRWEPYVIVSGSLPRWNEIFFGRHKNKISFVATLRKLNYHFFYTLGQFLVHQEHDFSLYKKYDFEDHNIRMESAFHHQLMQVKDTKS
jgi:hypothetical protein